MLLRMWKGKYVVLVDTFIVSVVGADSLFTRLTLLVSNQYDTDTDSDTPKSRDTPSQMYHLSL